MDVVTVLFIYCNVSPDEYYTKSFESKMPLSVCFLLALYMFASPSHLFIYVYIYISSLETLRPFQVVETALHHASFGIRCEMV